MSVKYLYELFEQLYNNNKYLITISNTSDNNWIIYINKNKYIQIDIQDSNILKSSYITIDDIIDYIENQESSIKISYVSYYDDFETYNELITNILTNIKQYYSQNGKDIIIKHRLY
jgi:hypothetical protein